MWLRGPANPIFIYDSPSLPAAAIQVKLSKFQQIAATEAQAATGLRNVQRRINPLRISDPQWSEQPFLGKLVGSHTGGFLKNFTERENSSGAIAEVASIGKRVDPLAYSHASANG